MEMINLSEIINKEDNNFIKENSLNNIWLKDKKEDFNNKIDKSINKVKESIKNSNYYNNLEGNISLLKEASYNERNSNIIEKECNICNNYKKIDDKYENIKIELNDILDNETIIYIIKWLLNFILNFIYITVILHEKLSYILDFFICHIFQIDKNNKNIKLKINEKKNKFIYINEKTFKIIIKIISSFIIYKLLTKIF